MRDNVAKRDRRRPIWATMYLWVVVGVLLFANPASSRFLSPTRSDSVASVELLVRNFERVVLGDDTTVERYEYVSKWTGPVRIFLFGSAEGQPFETVGDSLLDLHLLTDIDFQYVDPSKEYHDLTVILGKRDELIEKLREFGDRFSHILGGLDVDGGTTCTGSFGVHSGVIKRGVVVIATDLPPPEPRLCTLEQLVHVIGLRYHSDLVRPSILNSEPPTLAVTDMPLDLPLNDSILIYTLYDERIVPGMPRGEAMDQARVIIAELVDQVRVVGVTPED